MHTRSSLLAMTVGAVLCAAPGAAQAQDDVGATLSVATAIDGEAPIDDVHRLEAELTWSAEAGPVTGTLGVTAGDFHGRLTEDTDLEPFVAIASTPGVLPLDVSTSLHATPGLAGEAAGFGAHGELALARALPLGGALVLALVTAVDADLAPAPRLVDARLEADLVMSLDRHTEIGAGARAAWSWLEDRAVVWGVLSLTRTL